VIAHITLGDTAAISTIIALFGAQVVAIVLALRNGKKVRDVHNRVNTVDAKVDHVREDLKVPSSDNKTIGHQMEDVAQAFHLMAQIFEEQHRKEQ